MRQGIWLTILLAACGGGTSAPDAFSYGEVCEPGGTFDINGRAAVLGSLNVHVNASGLVETDTTAEILLVMDVTQNGTAVDVVAAPCAITIPEVPIEGQDQPIHLEVTQETIDSVESVVGTASLSSPDQTCADFATSELTIVIGAILDPLDSPLPEIDGDTGEVQTCGPTADTACDLAIGTNCACDQESDTFPGATLIAMNVPAVELDRIYVTLRTVVSLTGQVYDSDKVLGTIDAQLQQGILGCRKTSGDPCTLPEVRAVKVLNPEVTQQEGNPSLFRAIRVAEGTTCAEIIEMRDELFPR
jgi:hypothetical protein